MNPSAFKKHTTSRGFTYNYYRAVAEDSKPTLVFLHGFPSSLYDWRHQIVFFQAKGFGLIVPDMLGYAGTDKPSDPKAYVGSGIARDIVDILDAEGVQTAIAVGHDWGCLVVSRLVNFHSERLSAVAFLTVGYQVPQAEYNAAGLAAFFKQLLGRELFGYWTFLASEGADKVIETHFDSFFSIFFPIDPTLWATHVGPTGAIEAWLKSDKVSPTPAYITEDDKKHYQKVLLEGGFEGPLNWYKVVTEGFASAEERLIPAEAIPIRQPAFFAACTKDVICIPAIGNKSLQEHAKGGLTVKEFAADHWVALSHAEELNAALLKWIEGL